MGLGYRNGSPEVKHFIKMLCNIYSNALLIEFKSYFKFITKRARNDFGGILVWMGETSPKIWMLQNKMPLLRLQVMATDKDG